MPSRLRPTILLVLAIGLLAGCSVPTDEAVDRPAGGDPDTTLADGVTVTVHRTEACGCCGAYEDELEAAGFTVEQMIHEDLTEAKEGFGIPEGGGSCHTNELAGYAAEGHVPIAALLDLLAERPEVDGITLPGMPAGSPGMPGEQEEPFVVEAFVDTELVGEFGRY